MTSDCIEADDDLCRVCLSVRSPAEVDSDFDEDEDSEDEGEVEADKEKKGKKAGAYVDPRNLAAKRAAAAKKAVATKAARKAAASSAAASIASGPIDTGAEKPVTVTYDEDGFPTGQDPAQVIRRRSNLPASAQTLAAMAAGRKSVRKATMENSMETVKKRVEHAKKLREAKPKQKVVFRILTQEEQFAQAVETEKENAASLAQLLVIEEEKKKELAPKAKALGDRILWRSTKKGQLVAFTGEVPEYLQPELPVGQYERLEHCEQTVHRLSC